MSVFSKIWQQIEGFFTETEKEVVAFIDALAHSIASNGGTLLVSAATAAVEAAETQGGSASDKLKAATESVINTLESQGVAIVLNAVNGAIEAAVAQHRTGSEVLETAPSEVIPGA